jgi:capsular polysaccharide transport system permease protein
MTWSRIAELLVRRWVSIVTGLACLVASAYWLVIASDRFVSEAHVIIQRTELSGGQGVDVSSLLSGSGSANRADQLLLRDHLLSVDMLAKLDATLGLRNHYSDSRRDILSRMWDEKISMEWFHRHYLSRVSIEFDDYAGLLIIRAQGYDPKTAHAVASALVREGEIFMNALARSLAQGQVVFLEGQVNEMHARAMASRQALLRFQNAQGLVSPQATAENLVTIVSKLEAQTAELQAQRTALQAYLVSTHPSIVQLNQQIAAVQQQATQERAKLASRTGRTLNVTIEEFQRLELESAFAQDVYKTALAALERGRIEATRTIKQVSILQMPTKPEYPLEPRRLYNTLVFVVVALLLAGVFQLLAAIVRDHKD